MRARIAFVSLLSSAALAQSPEEFRATANLSVADGEGIHRVELPFEAHRWARRDLADVRFFNARGESLPFAFASAPPAEPAQREALSVPLFPILAARGASASDLSLDVRAAKDGTIIAVRSRAGVASAARATAWLADLTAIKDPLGAVIVEWERGPRTEVARVGIEASDDLKSWQAVASGTILGIEHAGNSLLQPRVEFPARTAKYLRLTSRNEGFALKAIRVERVRPASPAPLRTVSVEGKRGERAGELVYDLGAPVPVSQLQLVFPESNVVAPARLHFRTDERGDWRPVGSATFYRIVRAGEEVSSRPMEIAPVAARFWLVRIDPNAGVSGAVPRLEAGWSPRQIVFVSRGEAPYLLAVGHGEAARANLPIPTLIPGYERHAEFELPLARVESVREQRGEEGFSVRRLVQGAEGRKTVLWAVLLGGVLALAAMAWRIHRQTGLEAPQPKDGDPTREKVP